jgi:hypothetical protein
MEKSIISAYTGLQSKACSIGKIGKLEYVSCPITIAEGYRGWARIVDGLAPGESEAVYFVQH